MRNLFFGSISIMGLSFWFLLGFPFGNHNESYVWIARLHELGFRDFLALKEAPFPGGTRPLGQAIVWTLFHLSGGTAYLQQIFNFALAAAAWFVLFLAAKEKRIFSLVALFTGTAFFSGYLFLFHIHGVWYGPSMMLLALWVYHYPRMLEGYRYPFITLAAVAASLCYPLAGVIHAVFSIGLALERRDTLTRQQWVMLGLGTLLLLGLARHFSSSFGMSFDLRRAWLLVPFRMTEVNRFVAAASFLMCSLTIASLSSGRLAKLLAMALLIIASILMYKLGKPLIVLWILLSFIKAVSLREWSLVLLLAAVSCYATIPPGGTPAYGIFSVMVCAAILPMGWLDLEYSLGFVNNRMAVALAGVLLVLLVLMKSGARVPLVSKLAMPLLAEKEKTQQLEQAISWMLSSNYDGCLLRFSQRAGYPSESGNAIDRVHRPPSTEKYVDRYIAFLRAEKKQGPQKLIISFGNEKVTNAGEVHRVHGRYAGDAVLYLPKGKS